MAILAVRNAGETSWAASPMPHPIAFIGHTLVSCPAYTLKFYPTLSGSFIPGRVTQGRSADPGLTYAILSGSNIESSFS